MKITIITPSFPYPKRGELIGIERVAENLAIFLKKIGNKIKIVTTFWNGGKRYGNYNRIPILRVLDSKALIGKFGSIFHLNYFTFGLNIIRKKNFKFFSNSNVLILLMPIGFTRFFKKKNIPIISIFHHYGLPNSISDCISESFYNYLAKKQFKLHKNIVAVSNSSKNDLIKYYGINKKNIRVIPNGVDISKFNPSNKSRKIREKYNKNILLFSGFILHRKRVPILLHAMKYVIEEIPDVHLIILGEGPLLNYCKNLSYSYRIQNNTTFLGFVDEKELIKYYASSDIYILPSEKEGFGQVILEAMASGTPVICADKPPMSNIIENGGLTFKLNDSIDLSKKIIELLDNPEKLTNLRRNALRVVKKYEWPLIIKKYIDYIKELK